jgi:Flp pilus assembly protein TadG
VRRIYRNDEVERGAVAVEAALVMAFILVPLLGCCLFLGRYFWYYTVAQKAAHDAALYMAVAPLNEVKSVAASTLAQQIIAEETADISSDDTPVYGSGICGYKLSSTSSYITFLPCIPNRVPAAVRTGVALTVTDPFWGAITGPIFNVTGLDITVATTMTYGGR